MSTMTPLTTEERLNTALLTMMDHHIARYLMANTKGRLSGNEKVDNHIILTNIYVCNRAGIIDTDATHRVQTTDGGFVWRIVHDATQELTDYLDEVIDFPLDDERPDTFSFVRPFFNEFIRLADEAWDKLEIREIRSR